MAETKTPQFAIELSDQNRRYAQVHVAGCRDLRDPEPVPAPELAHVSLWPEGEEYTPAACYAPCVRKALGADEFARIKNLNGQSVSTPDMKRAGW